MTVFNVWGANGLLSRRTGTPSVYYTFDPQGSVVQRLDINQNILSTSAYDAWGNPLVANPNDPFGYDAQWGYYTDNETGFLLLTHRYYDPTQRRFLTRDPIGYEGGVNLYGYVGKEVIYGADPFGLIVYSIGIGVIGQVIGALWGDTYLEIQPVGKNIMNWKIGIGKDVGIGIGPGNGYGIGLEGGISAGNIENICGTLSNVVGGFGGSKYIAGGSIAVPPGGYPACVEGGTVGIGKLGFGNGWGFYEGVQWNWSKRIGTVRDLWQNFGKWLRMKF